MLYFFSRSNLFGSDLEIYVHVGEDLDGLAVHREGFSRSDTKPLVGLLVDNVDEKVSGTRFVVDVAEFTEKVVVVGLGI